MSDGLLDRPTIDVDAIGIVAGEYDLANRLRCRDHKHRIEQGKVEGIFLDEGSLQKSSGNDQRQGVKGLDGKNVPDRVGKDTCHEEQPDLQDVGIFNIRKIKDCMGHDGMNHQDCRQRGQYPDPRFDEPEHPEYQHIHIADDFGRESPQ